MFIDNGVLAPNSPVIPTSVAVAIVSAYALDYLKQFESIPQVTYFTTRINTLLRILMSGLGTLGVSWTWSAAGAGHQLLIAIPAWSALLAGLWHWIIAFGMQHFAEIQLGQRQTAKQVMIQQATNPGVLPPKPVVLQQDIGPQDGQGVKPAQVKQKE